jgi:hypothetical protein
LLSLDPVATGQPPGSRRFIDKQEKGGLMLKKESARLTGVRRRTLIIAVALMAPLTSLAIASPTLARRAPLWPVHAKPAPPWPAPAKPAPPKEPTGVYANFSQCPRFTAGVELCDYAEITGGEMILGKLTVPLVNPTPFQFGMGENTTGLYIVGAINGVTLAPVPQPVPGGLSSLIDCNEIKGRGFLERGQQAMCRGLLNNPWLTKVNETTELAVPPSELQINITNDLFEEGVALRMPVKIHLENPLLGRDCYIGSNADPIVYNFSTGETNPPPPNKPIHGSGGVLEIVEEGNMIRVKDHVEGDNAFSVPAATGCGVFPSSFIDSLINNKVGLPSPAGYNTIIHDGFSEEATASAVIASEK